MKIDQSTLLDPLKFWIDSLESSRIKEPKTFVEWLNTEYYLSEGAGNSAGPCVLYPNQVGLAHMYANLDIRELHNQKCGQAGITQIMLRGLAGYECSVRGRNTAVIQPTQGFAGWFSKLLIGTMLSDVPSVADELIADPENRNDSRNTTAMRMFRRATLYCRGANSSNDFRGYSVETMLVDEIDSPGLDDIEGEGSVDTLASSRLKEATRPIQRNQSTPTTDGRSRIQALVDAIADEFTFYYFVPCPHCGHMQHLSWGGSSADFGVKFDKVFKNPDEPDENKLVIDLQKTAKTARYQCQNNNCHKCFNHSQLREIDELGRWQSTTLYVDNETGNFHYIGDSPDDEPAPTPYKVAVRMCGTMSYQTSWSDAVYDFLEATAMARRGDPANLIKFQNGYLGEVHLPLDTKNMATWQQIQARCRIYDDCPDWVQIITIGTDIGQDHIAYEVVGWGAHYESISLERRRIECRPKVDGSIKKLFKSFVGRTFKKLNGEEMPLKIVMCDARYANAQVREACDVDPLVFVALTGYGTLGAPPVKMSNKPEPGTGVFTCRVATQTVADTVAELMNVELPVNAPDDHTARAPGFAHFPLTDWHDEYFFKELTNEAKKTTYSNGRPETRWQPRSKGLRVESTDCRRYAYAGVKLAELRYNFKLLSDEEYFSDKQSVEMFEDESWETNDSEW